MFSFILFKITQNQNIGNAKIDILQKTLDEYYMTDAISRSSPTMAKCIQTVKKAAATQ